MKFLLDQDVYALTEGFLRELGYDVVTAAELGLSRSTDSDLLKTAGEQKRIFVTRDRGLWKSCVRTQRRKWCYLFADIAVHDRGCPCGVENGSRNL